ncbi:tRNA synthetases class I (M)-domain-containing protein [Lipomyces doorenjongii]|uniref:tRNA synthetases class I (M)-domain-containing protein n=1 Tax=Lipomyces doorenjongii TaxID=383834 RepID=UPI0034CF96AA
MLVWSHCSRRIIRPVRTSEVAAALLLRRKPLQVCESRRYKSNTANDAKADKNVTTEKEEKPFYVTTPIFYVNAAPHMGHLYSMVLADTFRRWQQFMGRHTFLLTGTDEHGMKVQQAANKIEKPVKQFCDETSQLFKNLASEAHISNDRFIRTTDEDHREAVHKLWNTLVEKGYIYKGKHEGWYSVSDETFYPESQLNREFDQSSGVTKVYSNETGKEVEWASEENYFFALSRMREPLLELYNSRLEDKFVYPYSQFKTIIDSVENGLSDLSISRPSSRFTWGIPVPGDESQTIYVWVDALTNYLTSAGYGKLTASEFEKSMWPVDIHVVGKDITRFHCIYWPAFLLAAELPLPKHIVVHSHWLMNGAKMSKSSGNIVDPHAVMAIAGVDSVRYYLLRHNILEGDGDFDTERVLERRQSDLVFKYSNLVSRTCSKSFSIELALSHHLKGYPIPGTRPDKFLAFQSEMITEANSLVDKVAKHMKNFNPTGSLSEIWDVLKKANQYVDYATPWNTESSNISPTIFVMAEMCRIISIVLQPFLPSYAMNALDKLSVSPERRSIEYAKFEADMTYGKGANLPNRGHVVVRRG